MKYGYHFHDWNLWTVDEILEVKELTEDLVIRDCFGEHVFEKDKWVWAKTVKPLFSKSTYDGSKIHTEWVNEGPYYKANIFDTKEAADEYGKTHSGCFF